MAVAVVRAVAARTGPGTRARTVYHARLLPRDLAAAPAPSCWPSGCYRRDPYQPRGHPAQLSCRAARRSSTYQGPLGMLTGWEAGFQKRASEPGRASRPLARERPAGGVSSDVSWIARASGYAPWVLAFGRGTVQVGSYGIWSTYSYRRDK